MKYFCLMGMVAVMSLSCSKPSAEDVVRGLRRSYKIEYDFNVNNDTNLMTCEVKVQNLSGGSDLQELTLLLEAYDEKDQVFWSKVVEMDVTGLADYATKNHTFKETVPDGATKLVALNVRIAPDTEGSDYKNYREFKRVANQ